MWCLIKGLLSLREWARACGTSPTTYALRTPPIVAAEVRGGLGSVYQDLLEQIQLDMWSACHSSWRSLLPPVEAGGRTKIGCTMKSRFHLIRQLHLDRWGASHSIYFDLWQLHEAAGVTSAQLEQMRVASRALPLLHCLHVVGRPNVPLTESSVEGVLVSLLARHAAVLTLQVKSISMPLSLPNLQAWW